MCRLNLLRVDSSIYEIGNWLNAQPNAAIDCEFTVWQLAIQVVVPFTLDDDGVVLFVVRLVFGNAILIHSQGKRDSHCGEEHGSSFEEVEDCFPMPTEQETRGIDKPCVVAFSKFTHLSPL